jgi:hypothetical protein
VTEITTIDVTPLNDRLNQLADALYSKGKESELQRAFGFQGRLLMKQIIKITPPTTTRILDSGNTVQSGMGGDARAQGELAIDRDLKKIFTPVEQDFLDEIGSAHGVSNLDFWFENKQGEKVHAQFDRLDGTGAGMAGFHAANRNARGRTANLKSKGQRGTSAWYSPYVVTHEDFKAYADKIKARVGRRKAAWSEALIGLSRAMHVSAEVPRWILRHIPTPKGKFIETLSSPSHPGFMAVSFAPGVGDDARIISDAVRIRGQALGRLIKGILSDHNADWKRGLKIAKSQRLKVDA